MNKCSHKKDNSMPKLYCRQIVYLDVYLYSIKPIKGSTTAIPIKTSPKCGVQQYQCWWWILLNCEPGDSHFTVVNDAVADPQCICVDISVQCVLCSYKWP